MLSGDGCRFDEYQGIEELRLHSVEPNPEPCSRKARAPRRCAPAVISKGYVAVLRSCTWICQCPALVERAFASEPAGQHCIGQRQTIAEGTFRRIPDRKCWLNSVLLLGYVAIGIVGQQGGRDDADDSIEKDVHRNLPA